MGEEIFAFVSERSVWIGKKSMENAECFSMGLEGSMDNEAICRFLFIVLEEC